MGAKRRSYERYQKKAIKLAIEAMKPIPVCSSPCYCVSDNRSPEEKHEEEMRFCKEFNDLRCEMLIDMAKKIEEYLLNINMREITGYEDNKNEYQKI